MKISVNRQLLCETIANLSKAVSTKATIPVLEGILIEASSGKLCLTAYNLELGMKKELEASVAEEGTIVLNARIFGEMVRRLNGVSVTISNDEKMLCTISCGSTVFEIMGMNPMDYPELPEINQSTGVTIPSDVLRDMVRQTIFTVSQSENAKPVFTGLLFDIKNNEIKVAALDGYRLALRREKINYDGEITFIAAGKAIGEAVKIVRDDEKEIILNVGKRHFSITVDGYTIISRIIDGEFFDYKRILNRQYSTEVIADPKDIYTLVDRISLVINDQLKTPVRCFMHSKEMIFSCNTAIGKACDSCECELTGNELEIGFNSKYLTDALKATETEKVLIKFDGPQAPMLLLPIEGDSFVYMVTPIMLNK